jgi:hypothetical protein
VHERRPIVRVELVDVVVVHVVGGDLDVVAAPASTAAASASLAAAGSGASAASAASAAPATARLGAPGRRRRRSALARVDVGGRPVGGLLASTAAGRTHAGSGPATTASTAPATRGLTPGRRLRPGAHHVGALARPSAVPPLALWLHDHALARVTLPGRAVEVAVVHAREVHHETIVVAHRARSEAASMRASLCGALTKNRVPVEKGT